MHERPDPPIPTFNELPPPGYTETAESEANEILGGGGTTPEEAERYADQADVEDL